MRWTRAFHHRTIRVFLRGMASYLFGKTGRRRIWGLRLFYRVRMETILRTKGPIGRFTKIWEVRLWVDGEDAFDRIVRLIGRAQHSVVIQMFIWKDDATGRRVAKALVDAAERGVNVDVAKDAVGDIFETTRDFLGTKKSADEPWKKFWNHPRITINYGTHHDHAKVYVIDDQILLLSGMNISDEYLEWHDYLVELRGSRFVREFLTRETNVGGRSISLVMNTEDKKAIRPVLLTTLSLARQSIIFEHSYLSDTQVVDALISASRRGVNVIVILPSRSDFHHFANMQAVGRLLTEGDAENIQVLLHPTMIHAKTALIDRTIAFLGSANGMRSSLDDMGEVNVLIQGGHHRAIRKLREVLREDILKSRAIKGPFALSWISRWLAALGL